MEVLKYFFAKHLIFFTIFVTTGTDDLRAAFSSFLYNSFAIFNSYDNRQNRSGVPRRQQTKNTYFATTYLFIHGSRDRNKQNNIADFCNAKYLKSVIKRDFPPESGRLLLTPKGPGVELGQQWCGFDESHTDVCECVSRKFTSRLHTSFY